MYISLQIEEMEKRLNEEDRENHCLKQESLPRKLLRTLNVITENNFLS